MSLEQIKKDLIECYKKRQPVLLYGKDNVGRLDLVQEVHEENGGVIYPVEYIESEKEPYSKIFINEIGKQLKIAIYGERNKKTTLLTGAKRVGNPSLRKKPMNIQKIAEIENKVQLRFKSTDKNYREIDCEPYNGGEDVYDYLTQNTLLANIPIFNNPSIQVPINESFLFGFKGVLFLNNLYKYNNTNNKRDRNCYRLLGGIIKERKLVNPITKEQFNVAFRWLVIYADVDDPKKIFPKKFRDRFEPIPLSDKGGKAVATVKERIVTEGKRKDNFDDVKLEISADNLGYALDEAFVTVNKGKKEKLDLDSRFIEGLHSLGDAVKKDKNNGWVFNKDLDNTCSDKANKLKYEIINAFRKITGIGKRAEHIIETKHGVAKRLLIPRKNISFKRIS